VDDSDNEKFFIDTLVSPWPLPKQTHLLFVHSHSSPEFQLGDLFNRSTLIHAREKIIEKGTSPYPMLDQFLLECIRSSVMRSDIQLKQVRIFDDCKISSFFFLEKKADFWISKANVLVYTFANDRFCQRIGREHKRNAVYHVAELRKGIITQRCFDPDCRHFVSPSLEIPLELNPLRNQENSELEMFPSLEEIPDGELLNQLLQSGVKI
jgi:hypothetical protein